MERSRMQSLVICGMAVGVALALYAAATRESTTELIMSLLDDCPDPRLSLHGHWELAKDISVMEDWIIHKEVEFLQRTQLSHGIPHNFKLSSGHCGFLSLARTPCGNIDTPPGGWRMLRVDGKRGTGISLTNYTALCDPQGPTPCCYEGTCAAKPEAECRCRNCIDLRQVVPPHSADWISKDKRCPLRIFTKPDACVLLRKSKVIIVGEDLMMVHVYVAMAMMLSDNFRSVIDPAVKDDFGLCSAPNIFGTPSCLEYLQRTNRHACGNGGTTIKFINATNGGLDAALAEASDRESSQQWQRKILITGSNSLHSSKGYLQKVLQSRQDVPNTDENGSQVRLLWLGPDPEGRFRCRKQLHDADNDFTFLKARLEENDISFIDTTALMKDFFSFDGIHRGFGANVAKAQAILNFIWRIKD